jgi:transcriptional regulator with XRE-family HTH domain
MSAEARFYMTVGERIREARQARGWSQLRLSVELGVTPVAVHHWERGSRRPSVYVLAQIERLLHWTVRP